MFGGAHILLYVDCDFEGKNLCATYAKKSFLLDLFLWCIMIWLCFIVHSYKCLVMLIFGYLCIVTNTL
jgi:hypothetical protein